MVRVVREADPSVDAALDEARELAAEDEHEADAELARA